MHRVVYAAAILVFLYSVVSAGMEYKRSFHAEKARAKVVGVQAAKVDAPPAAPGRAALSTGQQDTSFYALYSYTLRLSGPSAGPHVEFTTPYRNIRPLFLGEYVDVLYDPKTGYGVIDDMHRFGRYGVGLLLTYVLWLAGQKYQDSRPHRLPELKDDEE